MANGGIFTIITNDGKQDRMLMATALLHARLNDINMAKMQASGNPAPDALVNMPTLLDIERTHVLFTNAHFKPFAAIGFEYNKCRSNSGNPSLGQTIQFSIPQFGDFFHDICAHIIVAQPTLASTSTLPVGNQPLMRWCDFPGERLFKRVQMEVNGNPLDEYYYQAVNFHREFRVSVDKYIGWSRCVGQEVPERGFVQQPDWASNGVAASAITSRVVAEVANGNQTPSGQKTTNLEMFIPLLFWYNKDVRLAVPSVAIPYGQRFINIELATGAELYGLVPRGAGTFASPLGTLTDATTTIPTFELYINNIFVNPEIHKIYIKRIGFTLIRVHRKQFYDVSTETSLLLQQLKWPIEWLFVGMKIKDYASATTAELQRRNLDKWYKFCAISTTTSTTQGQNILLSQELVDTSIAGETLGIAQANWAAPAVAALLGTAHLALTVASGDLIMVNGVIMTVETGAAAAAAVTGVTVRNAQTVTVAATTAIALAAKKLTLQGLQIQTQQQVKTMDTIAIQAHGINIYTEFPEQFYNAYTSYHFGGVNINTPYDLGACFIPFCLFPATYQPSGHINVSRAREFYINWTTSVINTVNSAYTGNSNAIVGTLCVVASAINFLLISDGSAVLRYST